MRTIRGILEADRPLCYSPRMPDTPKYPSNPWGPFADDPWSPLLDLGLTGPAWDRAIEDACRIRLAEQRMDDALARMERERREREATTPTPAPSPRRSGCQGSVQAAALDRGEPGLRPGARRAWATARSRDSAPMLRLISGPCAFIAQNQWSSNAPGFHSLYVRPTGPYMYGRQDRRSRRPPRRSRPRGQAMCAASAA